MKGKTKLTARIGNLIIAVLIGTVTFILIGTMIASFYQTSKVYNDKTMQVARQVSEALAGEDMAYLLSCVDDDGYRAVRERAEKAGDPRLIADYLAEKTGSGAAAGLAESCNDMLAKFREDFDIEYLYVSVIQGEYSIDLLDADTGLLALGYKTPLMEKFRSLNGNERVDPTVTRSEYGWLSSGGVPITDREGNAVAIAFCDISMENVVRDTLLFTGGVLAVCAVIILITRLMINRKVRRAITAPIEELTAAADRFAANEKGVYTHDDVADLDIHTGDEIEDLYKSVRFMQTSLIDYMDNLTRVMAEKERIGAELSIAAKIQADMLPRIFPGFTDREEFVLSATMDPAKEVGGDFYDFFMVDDTHLCLVMADVSGKGVPAALFMVISKTLIKNRAQRGDSPAQIMANVNAQLCDGNEAQLFVTVWLAIIDLETGRGVAANAGHEHPVLRRSGGRYETVVYRHSPALATVEGIRFREHEFRLDPGDTLFVYTDGVPEATDTKDRLFGSERMLGSLNRHPDAEPEELLRALRKDVDDFVGDAPQFDDITMLAIRYDGPKKDGPEKRAKEE